ncbi:MAG TPA: helix-turn-helix transcriptional regulator [Candidatus Limnocylindrales bacterium]|jgi:transcriptional regulator with XRE-family HTH domain
MAIAANLWRAQIGQLIRTTREALGWSLRELGRRAGVSASQVCRIENDQVEGLSFEVAARLLSALGVKVEIGFQRPAVLGDVRQRDAAHARCVAFVAGRLRRLAWLVETEVLIARDGAFGWIDVLAYRPSDRTQLVIEVKTQLPDIGAAMRQVAWYERNSRWAARDRRWVARRTLSALLVLATHENVVRLAANRDLLRGTFSLPAPRLQRTIAGGTDYLTELRGLALIDPLKGGATWLMRSPLDGWSATPDHADYRSFVAAMDRRRAAA